MTRYRDDTLVDIEARENSGIEEDISPSQIIGYSSGLNENLQRAFMTNTIQYLDVMNVKRQWEQYLALINEARNETGKHLTEIDIEWLVRQCYSTISESGNLAALV